MYMYMLLALPSIAVAWTEARMAAESSRMNISAAVFPMFPELRLCEELL
jgi:hypothetical protein